MFKRRPASLSYRASFLLVANGIRGITNIVIYMVLSRYISQDDYGSFRQVWLLVTILSQLVVFGLPASITYFISGRNEHDQSSYLFQALSLIFVTSIIQVLMIIIFKSEIALLFNNNRLAYLLIVAIPLFLIYPYTHIISPSLVAKGHYLLSAAVNIVYSVIVMGTLVSVAIIYPGDVYLIKSYGIGIIVFVLIAFGVFIIKFKNVHIKLDWSKYRDQVKYSFPLGLALSIELISKFTDKIIVSNHVSPRLYSIYANGAFEIPFISMISGAAMAILFPEFVKYYRNKQNDIIAEHWKNSIRKTSLFLIPVMIFFLAYSTQIIVVMYSEKYFQSARIFSAYLLLLPLRVTIISQVLSAFNENRYVLKSTVIGLVINIILTIILINKYGMIGAPVGTVISLYIVNGYMLVRVRKNLGISIANLLPTWELLKTVFISVLMLLIVKNAIPAMHSQTLMLAVAAAIYFGGYFSVAMTGKVVRW